MIFTCLEHMRKLGNQMAFLGRFRYDGRVREDSVSPLEVLSVSVSDMTIHGKSPALFKVIYVIVVRTIGDYLTEADLRRLYLESFLKRSFHAPSLTTSMTSMNSSLNPKTKDMHYECTYTVELHSNGPKFIAELREPETVDVTS